MALKGLTVVELASLAPGPFCGMILSDFGADVIRIEKPAEGKLDQLTRGKRTVCIDLKNASGKAVFKRLCSSADIIIEPFRPMVMERLGLGPDVLMQLNKRLIYARLSGFGQNGDYANKAGHDLNYLAVSGVLSLISGNGRPTAPINMLADFAGGGLMCAFGILVALHERNESGMGQVIDCSMVEGVRYVSSYMWHTHKPDSTVNSIIWPNKGKTEANLLDGGCPFYDVYKTKDNRWISVAALEQQFYQSFLNDLGLNYVDYEQSNVENWPLYKAKFSEIFAEKTLAEWVKLFSRSKNSCVEPVLYIDEVDEHDKIHTRPSFLEDRTPKPAPLLSRTPAQPNLLELDVGDHTTEVLKQFGYTDIEIHRLFVEGAICFSPRSKL